MEKKAVSGIMLTLLLIGMLSWTFNIQLVEASGTVYIRSDGSVDPPGAPISSPDNITYTFTGNINDFLVIERCNIIVDGVGYRIQGPESGRGIDFWDYASNITIRNIDIRGFEYGIYAELCWDLNISRNNIEVGVLDCGILLHWSWNNIIARNNFTSAWGGVAIDLNTSPDNTIAENYISGNEHGIQLNNSLNCRIVKNDIDSNGHGIELMDSSNNNILAENNVTFNPVGIYLSASSNNTLDGNNVTLSNDASIILRDSLNNSLIDNTIIGRPSFSQQGIWLNSSSDNNTLARNIIAHNRFGISLTGSSNNNTLVRNNVTKNWDSGIYLVESSNCNRITGNNVTENWAGIWLTNSSRNTLAENNLTRNEECGIFLEAQSSDNRIYHNNIADNLIVQAIATPGYANSWDEGYPSGGNYWSDYGGADLHQGPYQNETGSDNMGDSSYTINVNNTDRYPLMDLWTPLFDIAVLNVTLSKTVVCQGFNMSINITVENQGIWPQAFNVTVYAFTMPPAIPIVTLVVPYLAPQTSKTLRFTWNTSGFGKGHFTISVTVTSHPYERDTADNTFDDGIITVAMVADLIPDGVVDIFDLVALATHFGHLPPGEHLPGTPEYWACFNADINGDGIIDIFDLVIIATHYGEIDP